MHDATALSSLPVPAPVLGFLLVHAALRRESSALARAADAGEPVGDRIVLIDRVLRAHHHGEDRVLLPLLSTLDPAIAEVAAEVEAQHVALDDALDALRALAGADPDAVAAAVHALCDALQAHLELEETRLLPAWLASLSPADHERFGQRLRRSTPWRDVAVMIPWLLDAVPAELQHLAVAELPPHVRLVHRAVLRRRFERRWRSGAPTGPAVGAADLVPAAA
jgi:hypothetical protein